MIGFVQTTTDIDAVSEAPVFSGEPALHRRWLVTVVVLFTVGYLLQYPILVLTGIFIIVFRYGAHWYSERALRGMEYSRDFSLRRIFPHEEDVSARHSIFQDPVRTVGVRDYRPSDSFRHVHWKASARMAAMRGRRGAVRSPFGF